MRVCGANALLINYIAELVNIFNVITDCSAFNPNSGHGRHVQWTMVINKFVGQVFHQICDILTIGVIKHNDLTVCHDRLVDIVLFI